MNKNPQIVSMATRDSKLANPSLVVTLPEAHTKQTSAMQELSELSGSHTLSRPPSPNSANLVGTCARAGSDFRLLNPPPPSFVHQESSKSANFHLTTSKLANQPVPGGPCPCATLHDCASSGPGARPLMMPHTTARPWTRPACRKTL